MYKTCSLVKNKLRVRTVGASLFYLVRANFVLIGVDHVEQGKNFR